MARKSIEKIKHGKKVLKAVETATFFIDIERSTSLDSKTLQRVLANLQKHGYVVKGSKNEWVTT